MSEPLEPVDKLIYELKERAKELNCLYEVQELLNTPDLQMDEICTGIILAIPPGWQFPDVCQARITFEGKTYTSPGYKVSPWVQSAGIRIQDKNLGQIEVSYTVEKPAADEGPFLKEERRLIDSIAEQLGFYLLHRQLKEVFEEQLKSGQERKAEWWVIFNLLKRTDPNLLLRISRKMINYLYWNGVAEAARLLEHFSPAYKAGQELLDENRPYRLEDNGDSLTLSTRVFELAGENLSSEVILENIQAWIREDQSSFLLTVTVNPSTTLTEIDAAIERYQHLASQGLELPATRQNSVLVSMIRRLLSDQPEYVAIAKQHLQVEDFNVLLGHTIFPVGSHGKLGGKSSGLVLAAQILAAAHRDNSLPHPVKVPKTWYIASDSVFKFLSYNNLEDILEQKYKDLAQVRQEYPYVLHVFKNSPFPPEIVKGLSIALDDFGDVPLIVRSSSLLEDRMGASFAGKYKSLFIANQGTKEERLAALLDAIAEVYASSFGPDPIEYRLEHDLIDHHEEMGIMIQEVVGAQVGHYYMPAFAGVAFSQNEFRWSARIRPEDGLIRLVPGLGTRAVDRLTDDWPILVAPGQPGLRVNVTLDEVLRYSPKMIDVINLDSGSFETTDLSGLLKMYGSEYPLINRLVSVLDGDHLRTPRGLSPNFHQDDFVVNFESLLTHSPYIRLIHGILTHLQAQFGHPVDIEFACDGTDFYLLQCRSQSYRADSQPAPIPGDISPEDILFTANRHITNGWLSNISHIVYVDPDQYGQIANHQELLSVGRAVGKLNTLLPRRAFILMGPGRWGSRGDIRLGVSVTYSDISNTCLLVEIERGHAGYTPSPSFGTHFFQDLVEASIRYLPLFPDKPGIRFNQEFFDTSSNLLPELLPEYAGLSAVIRVIDLTAASGGSVLEVRMNANLEKAVAYLTRPA